MRATVRAAVSVTVRRRAAGGGRWAVGGGRRAVGGGRRAAGAGWWAAGAGWCAAGAERWAARGARRREAGVLPTAGRRSADAQPSAPSPPPAPDLRTAQPSAHLFDGKYQQSGTGRRTTPRAAGEAPREAASDRLDRRDVPVKRYRTSNNPATGAAPRSSSTGRTSKPVPDVEQLPAGGDASRTARRPAHLSGGRGAVKRGDEEAQASSVSSRRLRVRFTSTGMPGPMVVDTVIFVM